MTFDLAVEAMARNVPGSWRVEPFRRHATLVNETNSKRSLPLLSLASTGIIAPRTEEGGMGRQAPSESTIERYWVARPGNLVVNPMWLIGGGIGVSAVTGAVSPDYRVYRLGSDLHPRYMHHLLRSAPYRDQYRLYTRADTTFDRRVSKENFHPMPLLIPPLEEQRRIADFLDAETAHIDQLVGLQVTLRARLDERDNALRDNLVNELAKTVGEAPLRRFTTRIEQGASPQCEAVPRQGDDEWGVLKLSAVKGGHFVASENKRLPEDTEVISAYQVRRGDLLVTRANTPSLVGDVAVVEGDHQKLLLPDLIYRVGLAPEMNADFVAQVALSGRVRTLIESVARGSSQSMVKLRGEDIKSWPVPMATQTQQDVFVQEIRSGMQGTGRLRTAVARQLSLLAERRQALITAAVTGQFDVSTASGRNVSDGVTA